MPSLHHRHPRHQAGHPKERRFWEPKQGERLPAWPQSRQSGSFSPQRPVGSFQPPALRAGAAAAGGDAGRAPAGEGLSVGSAVAPSFRILFPPCGAV